jgi:hypothetical protein
MTRTQRRIEIFAMAGLLAGAAAFPAWAGKSCEVLKDEIAAKITAKGVKDYTLDIVAPQDVGTKRVVGSCEGGTKRIVYSRMLTEKAVAY